MSNKTFENYVLLKEFALRFECNCAEGYSGSTCEIELDECDSSPCKNDAYCIDYPASFYCDCRKGYDGVFCEIGSRKFNEKNIA